MVIWGAVWGAILALLTSRHDWDETWIAGAILGAVAGWTLRKAIRTEMAAHAASRAVVPGTEAKGPALPVAPPMVKHEVLDTALDFADTHSKPFVPTQPAPLTPGKPSTEVTPAVGALAPQTPWSEQMESAEPDLLRRLFSAATAWLLGGNTIVRLGVVVLFVGFAFLAKYAMDNALLPPELRLAAIGAAGIALFAFGFRLRGRQPEKVAYALTLQGAGVAVLYLTVFAAFRLFQFLPAGAAFVVLGLICAFSTTIALLQNAMPMAFIGFAGAFAAPLLVSTGQGSHVGLFSYYLLLGVGIAAVAWMRAWRALNLLGFFATFGVATAWGALKYQAEFLNTTEPFLLAFFLLYLAASLMYATRHSLQPKQAVDATLIFGLPLVAFGLQAALVYQVEYATAFSSLAMGALYLGLGWWAIRRKDEGVGQWLAECFVALGLGFVTLAVPLALDARWTSAVWAAEGAAVFWMGQRQGRWLARLAGLALQGFAAVSYLGALEHMQVAQWPLANPAFIGAVLLSVSALALAHWTRAATAPDASYWEQRMGALQRGLSPVLFWVGFLWVQLGLLLEIQRVTLDASSAWVPVFSSPLQSHLEMLAWLVGAWIAHRFALPARARPWSIAATPAWFSLPLMGLFALQGVVEMDHVFQDWGWLVWPLALLLHGATLRKLDALAPQVWWSWVHTGGVWLLVLLGGNGLVWAVQWAQLQRTSWASVVLLVASVLVLLALCYRHFFDPTSRVRLCWPLQRFAMAYVWRAALPLACGVALGAMVVAVHSNGNAHPLPYVPLLNPTDLAVALALAACALWLSRVRHSGLPVPTAVKHKAWDLVLVALAFIAINTVWLRVAHQWAGVPWHAERLFDSFLVQAGYSILWTLLALGLMVAAHLRHVRTVWMGGATLLGLTVAKLFLVDLSNQGGSERIVAFIAVGVMMLVVGYFAPLPPRAQAVSAEPQEGTA